MRTLLAAAVLAALLLVPIGRAQTPDSPARRRAAADALFTIPVYRQLATRQLYQAIAALPDAQREKAHAGLDDPRVVDAVREVILRSSAQVYSVGELEYLARMLSAPEAESFLQKSDEFEATLTRELFAAALTHPDLHRLLIAP